jgi:hypothetical protein
MNTRFYRPKGVLFNEAEARRAVERPEIAMSRSCPSAAPSYGSRHERDVPQTPGRRQGPMRFMPTSGDPRGRRDPLALIDKEVEGVCRHRVARPDSPAI